MTLLDIVEPAAAVIGFWIVLFAGKRLGRKEAADAAIKMELMNNDPTAWISLNWWKRELIHAKARIEAASLK